MYVVKLRQVGGSLMLAIPPAILEMLDMDANSCASLHIDNGKIIIEPENNKKYTLNSLLAECQPDLPHSNDSEWINGKSYGQELI